MLVLKMLRDMGRHRTQFISIFLMAFLAIFIYAGVGGEWRGLQKSADDFYAETNLADVWIYGGGSGGAQGVGFGGAGFSEAQAEAVGRVDGVGAVERRLEMNAVGDFENKPVLNLCFAERNEISSLYIVEGAGFDKNDAGGIWLSQRFAEARGVGVGDVIGFSVSAANGANDAAGAVDVEARSGSAGGGADTHDSLKFEKTIRGLVYSAEHVFESASETLTPDFSDHGYAYLSANAFPAPVPGMPSAEPPYNTLLVKTDGTSPPAAELERKIDAALDGRYSVYLERVNLPSVNMFANEIQQHKMMGDIFPVVFLLIALLTMMTTMTRMVANQRVQVGTLKALGVKRGAILRHYLSYGFFLALFGAALGVAVGPATLPYLFYPSMSSFYTLPEWKPAYAPEFLFVSAALVLLCTAVSLLACGKLLSESPADTLRPKAPKAFRHGALERTKFWRRLSWAAKWNVRDASRSRARSLMAVIGVFGCTALVVCAFSMNDCMKDLKTWQYETVNLYESKLILGNNLTSSRIDEITEEVNGEKIMEVKAEIRANGRKQGASLLVTDGTELIRPTDSELKPTKLPEIGISITEKTAELLGVGKGDSIEWHVYGEQGWMEGSVEKVYREPVNQGITMRRGHFESLGMEFRPTAVLSAKKVVRDIDGVDSVVLTSESSTGWDDLTEAMYTMVYLLIAAAAVLSVVVLYNLGMLSFTEMEREMATLKVMGMKSGRLRGLLLSQSLWFTAIGFVLGVPAGMWLTSRIVAMSGDSFDFPVFLHAPTLLIALAFAFGMSALVNLFFSGKIRYLDMVGSLKGVE
ncbi:MAG: ABC transporter permease [Clostridiales Family XIII bacterium]|jgi:putative ABC transport system permease protein|nr:ABC transporter permease [Clostridiales Family XIII bacterium]